MTEEESSGYVRQMDDLRNRLSKRKVKMDFYKDRLSELKLSGEYEEIDRCISELDKMLKECKLDQELREDIENMLEVEHFLEFGNGRTFDVDYNE